MAEAFYHVEDQRWPVDVPRARGASRVLLVHPGGPFWQTRDEGGWTIPKGGIGEAEQPLAAAQREFKEETGFEPQPPFLELAPIKQKGGKIVQAWAFAGDCDPNRARSNTFTMEWPPRSGQVREFPEIDRAAWFGIEEAKKKLNAAQVALLEDLQQKRAQTSK